MLGHTLKGVEMSYEGYEQVLCENGHYHTSEDEISIRHIGTTVPGYVYDVPHVILVDFLHG